MTWNGWVEGKKCDCKRSTCGHGPESGPLSTNDVDHCKEFICMHSVGEKQEGIEIGSTERFMDCIVEIDTSTLALILTETWRPEVEETVLTQGGNELAFAGGDGHGGVGRCISQNFVVKCVS